MVRLGRETVRKVLRTLHDSASEFPRQRRNMNFRQPGPRHALCRVCITLWTLQEGFFSHLTNQNWPFRFVFIHRLEYVFPFRRAVALLAQAAKHLVEIHF